MPDQGNGYFDAGINRRFGVSLSRLFAPCAATTFGRRAPFSPVAYAVWRSNRLRGPCSRIRHPSEVSACSILRELHHRETGGTSALPKSEPSSQASRRRELCGRSRPERYSNAAVQNVFQCRLARVVLIRAILSNGSQSA